jgi:small subunit ribosomal protein S20
MPIIKSAKKRVRVTNRATQRNRGTRNTLRMTIKNFTASLTGGKKTSESYVEAQQALDKAVKKGVIHKNKAARKKAQLARAMKESGAKTEKSTKVKAEVKKVPAKKSATKQPVTKKTAAKKPAPKKK